MLRGSYQGKVAKYKLLLKLKKGKFGGKKDPSFHVLPTLMKPPVCCIALVMFIAPHSVCVLVKKED